MQNALSMENLRKELPGVAITVGLVAALTVALFVLVWEYGLEHGSVVYLIPVVIAATRWGIVSAITAAVCGVLASAYFFYPPLYTFRITNPQEVINLVLFIFVAVVVSQLAGRLKWQLEMARQREIDLRDLYAFSRRLAVAFDVSDIHAAIEDHLASIMQRRVVLFASGREASAAAAAARASQFPNAFSPRWWRSRRAAAIPPAARPSRQKAARSGWCARCRPRTWNSASLPSISGGNRMNAPASCESASTPCWPTPRRRWNGSASHMRSARRACARRPTSCAKR